MKLVVGDIHGCFEELQDLLKLTGFKIGQDELFSVGDLVDRGPLVKECLDFFRLTPKTNAVRGNHDNKLLKFLSGRNVRVKPYMQASLDALGSVNKEIYREQIDKMPDRIDTDDMILVHAQPYDVKTPIPMQDRSVYMYGNRKPYKGHFVRYNWWNFHRPGKLVVFGHYWFAEPVLINNVAGIDTCCVVGGKLTGLILGSNEIVQVPARQKYFQRDEGYDAIEQEAWRSNWNEK